jgi:molecular chaperone HtpG
VLSELDSLADKQPDDFKRIWDAFGRVLKEGIYEDHERRDQLLGLARFETTNGAARSLKDYVAGFRPNQTEIYYLVGESIDRLRSNPKLEAARARGIEVLLLTDPVDALWTAMPLSFEGKPLKSLSQGEVDFGLVPLMEEGRPTEEGPKAAEVDEAAVIEAVRAALDGRVSEVRASQRLTDSAACLVASGGGPDRELERLLARQNRAVGAKPILELNMRHSLVQAVGRARAGGHDDDVTDLASLLLEQAQVLDGEVPDDPAAFAARINRLVVRGLGR